MGLQVGQYNNIKTITANYTCNGQEDLILVNAASGAVTVTLASPINLGKTTIIKKVDSSLNIVTLSSGSNIDGASSTGLYYQNDFIQIVQTGLTYYIIDKFVKLAYWYSGSTVPSGTIGAAYNPISYVTGNGKDSHNRYSGSTYTVLIPGSYELFMNLQLSAGTITSGQQQQTVIYANGSSYKDAQQIAVGNNAQVLTLTCKRDCLVGDTIVFYDWCNYNSGSSIFFNGTGVENFAYIQQLS